MLYRFTKILMTVALRFYYRKMYVTGLEAIPSKGPAIILSNHPSSLMDAAIIGLLLNRPVHFFTRGDVFISKPVNYLLSLLRMIPVHNHDAGRGTLGVNDDSFEKAEAILSKGGILLFFPEGNSQPDRQLMPLRKGIFRLAFQTAVKNNYSYDIPFIPVGLNYEHSWHSFKDVVVQFNAPFYLSSYRDQYEKNPAAAILKMTKDGFVAMEKNVLHIKDASRFKLTEDCLMVYRNNYYFFTDDWMQATVKRFAIEKAICDQVNEATEEELVGLNTLTSAYSALIKDCRLNDRSLSPQFTFTSFKKAMLVLCAPLFAIGWLLNAVPLKVGRRIADTKVYREDFYSWVYVVSTSLLYLFWLILLFAGFLFIGWKYAAGIVLATVLPGILYFSYQQWWQDYKQYRTLKRFGKHHSALFKNLLTLRVQILNATIFHSSVLQQLPGLIK